MDDKNAVVLYDTEWRQLWESRFSDPLEDAESFRINGDGLIQGIGQNVTDIKDIQGQFMGLMRFSHGALSRIIDYAAEHVDKIREMEMTTLLSGLIISGYPIHGIPISGGWCEIDKVEDIALAERLLSAGQLNLS